MDKNPFLKRLMKVKTKDVIHSTSYANSQNQGIGTASSETFSARQAVDQNRTTIKGYRDAKIVTEGFNKREKAKTFTESLQACSKDKTKSSSSFSKMSNSNPVPNAGPKASAPQIKPNIKPNF